MASPLPESNSTAPPKQADDAATKESKAEVNGHVPESESKSEAEKQPEKKLTNGTGKENGASNGVDQDVEMKNGDDSKEAASNKSEKSDGPEQKDAATSTSPKESSKDKDVDMKDSEPTKDKSTATDDKKTSDTKEPATKSTGVGPEDPDKAKDSQDAGESGIDLQPASLSQLAIDGPEPNTSPVEPSVEVSMTDAPASKVPREREDDGGEEPAPKRAKTEPKEDEPATSTPADGQEIAVLTEFPKPKFDEFVEWYDSKNSAKEITPHRRREMRRTVARVKKTKHGGEFRDSVQKLWPALWEKYSLKIEKPMDLSEIDRNLRDAKYKTYGDFKLDLALLVENSQAYNGPDHYITMAARGASKTVWDDVVSLPEEEPSKPKAPPKANRIRELRVGSNVKAEAPTGGSSPAPAAAPPAKASQSSGGEARRSSSVHDGDRPKRTVRAPKPKDIDYTSKPARKKLRPELQFCEEVLAEVTSQKHWSLNQWFLDAVDAEGLGIPHYYSVIKHPMDLGKISRMLASGEITSLKEFHKNVTLMFDNCYQFNGPHEQGGVSALAKQLQDIYTAQMKNKDAWLAKHAKANPPPASVSNPSDDDDDEDEEDGQDDNTVADHTRAVKELEARLREEMDKQANLFAAEQPNQSMITIQQGIVSMVQEALLKAKTTLNEVKQKHPAGKPKKSKPAKAKAAAGGAGRKAAGAAAQPKKAGSGPAKNKKKNLSAADKDHIAGAINDLEYPHLDRAIDIIKRDTGQMESEDGELELDIDQLSNDALLKLWELCKKALPGFAKDAAAQSPEVHRAAPSKSAPKTAAKPKKNKPMSAQEQEARIAQLREIRDLYKEGQDVADDRGRADSPAQDSSDDSSEEE